MNKKQRHEQQLQQARHQLQLYVGTARVALSPAEWLSFKLGITLDVAARLVEELKEEISAT